MQVGDIVRHRSGRALKSDVNWTLPVFRDDGLADVSTRSILHGVVLEIFENTSPSTAVIATGPFNQTWFVFNLQVVSSSESRQLGNYWPTIRPYYSSLLADSVVPNIVHWEGNIEDTPENRRSAALRWRRFVELCRGNITVAEFETLSERDGLVMGGYVFPNTDGVPAQASLDHNQIPSLQDLIMPRVDHAMEAAIESLRVPPLTEPTETTYSAVTPGRTFTGSNTTTIVDEWTTSRYRLSPIGQDSIEPEINLPEGFSIVTDPEDRPRETLGARLARTRGDAPRETGQRFQGPGGIGEYEDVDL